MVVTLFLTGITSIPLNRLPAQDAPPGPEATEAANADSTLFLPMSLHSPWVSPPTPIPTTPTPPTPTTPVTPTPVTPTPPTPTLPPIGNAIIVDHTSLALFDQIPEQYLTAARNIHLFYSDRSVGADIDAALNCLAAPSWADSPSYCRKDYIPGTTTIKTYTAADLAAGNVPALIQFPASAAYNRDNWDFLFQQGTWSDLTGNFITQHGNFTQRERYQVLTYQFSYLNFNETLSIIDPSQGFFVNTARYNDVTDLEAWIAAYPNETFFYWTTSLARTIGTQESTDFNHTMRVYAIEHDKILFDVADIESHDRNGQPCYDNVANDGGNYPAICPDYTSESVGGHLGSVSGGMITLAKAYWVLMARIAGWNP